MAANYVEILVKSRDDAKPDIDDLKAKLDELKHTVAEARVSVQDADAAAKLDRLQARLIDLSRKVAKPDITVTGALRAEAEIHAVEAALERLNGKEAEVKIKVDESGFQQLLGRLFDGAGGGGGGLGGLGGLFTKGLGSPAVIAAIAAALVPVVTEVTALASGFAAAGAGAVAFYALAHPAINNLQGDIQALDKANQNLGYAQQRALIDPSKANLAALKKANEQYQAIYQQMGQDAGGAAAGVLKLHDEYVKLTNAFQPDAFKVFNAGLRLANTLLPDIVPFAKTFADVLGSLLGQANKFAESKGFADWLKQFHSIEGPALNAIGQGIGNVANAIGKLLTTMSGKDVAHAFNIAFGTIADTIRAVAATIKFLMNVWDGASIAFRTGGHAIASAVDSIRQGVATAMHAAGDAVRGAEAAWQSLVSSAKAVYNGVMSAFNSMVHGIETAIKAVASVVSALPGQIKGFFAGAGGWLVAAGEAIMGGLLHGIEAAWNAVAGFLSGLASKIAHLKGPLDADILLLVPHGQAIMQGLMNGMASRMPALRSQLAGVSQTISDGTGFFRPGMAGYGGGYGSGGGTLRLEISPGGGSAFEQFMTEAIRSWVRVKGGGSVQQAFGRNG